MSHRALLLAALAPGVSRLRGLNDGADVQATTECIAALGARVTQDEGEARVERSHAPLRAAREPLWAGNSGSTIRMLCGILAGVPGRHTIDGDESLRRRPMDRVAEPLRAMGAAVEGIGERETPPLSVTGADLHGITLNLRVASAQVKSCVLLAGLCASGPTMVTEPTPTRDHTERMLAALGVPIEMANGGIRVSGGHLPAAFEFRVPGDLSSALYLVAAALLVEGSSIELLDVGLNPTRTHALELLARAGASVSWEVERTELGEPIGRIRAEGAGRLQAFDVTPADVAAVIDEIPILALVMAASEGVSEVRGAGELRVKESDRIATLAAGLNSLGVEADELDDGLRIHGSPRWTGGHIRTHGDHRIALTFAVARYARGLDLHLDDEQCAAVSFPDLRGTLTSLTARS